MAKDWVSDAVNIKEFKIKNKRSNKYLLYDSDGKKYNSEKSVHDFNNVYIKYRGNLRKVLSEEETRSSTDLYYGVKDSARIIPFIKDDKKIEYLVLYEEI